MNKTELITKINNECKKYDNKYNALLVNILSNAENLVDISNGVYQIEHNIRANKISLKDYLLNSDICTILKDNNISNYSINELREYIARYNSNSTVSYSLALNLYEQFETLESIEKDKVEYEVNELKEIIDLVDINKLSIDDLDSLLEKNISKIKMYSLSNNELIILNKLLQEIFSYYKYGEKKIALNPNAVENNIDTPNVDLN